MKTFIQRSFFCFCFTFAMFFLSCTPHSAYYNETSYSNAISLKVDALYIMNKATEPYAEHAKEISQLNLDIEKAVEFAKWIPNNQYSIGQWQILIDPEKNLLGGFIKRWKDENVLGKAFIQDSQKQVASAFDEIIKLESAKIKR